MELERGKKCADAQMLVPSHARKTQLISQAVKSSFLLYDGNWHCLTWSMAPLLLHFRSRWFVWSTVWRFRFLLYSGPLWVLRDSEPPGVARNTAKTLGSLKSLTLKFKALVLHNLDWAESSSIIKVIYYICNHWDYLYRFVGIALFSSIVMLWDLQGGYGWLQDEHVDWDAAHKREELRFCLMQDFVFFPDSRLCCETHICLHLPTACFSPSNGRSNQTREICSCFIDEGRGLCLVLVSPIDFWPCGFLSSRFPKLLAVSWLDIPFSMYSDTHQLPCIRPCLPTSHRWGETCEGFSSFRPTQLVAVRGYTVYVNPFCQIMFAFLARFLLGLWGVSGAVVWLQNVWIPWLRKYALPHSTSSSWRFCFASKVENWSQFSSPWSSVCFSWYSWGPESGLSGWMNLQESVLLFPTCFQGVLDGKGMKRG